MEGGDDHARSFLVEAVGDGGLEVKPFSATPFPQVFHEALAGASAGTRLACKSRGLVHDHIVFGLDDNVEFLCTPATLFFGWRCDLTPGGLCFCKTGAGLLRSFGTRNDVFCF